MNYNSTVQSLVLLVSKAEKDPKNEANCTCIIGMSRLECGVFPYPLFPSQSTSPSRSKRLEQSCAEMSAGRPVRSQFISLSVMATITCAYIPTGICTCTHMHRV